MDNAGEFSAASVYTTDSDLGNNEKFYAFPTPGYFPIDDVEMSSKYEVDIARDTRWSITLPENTYKINESKIKLKLTCKGKVYNITSWGYDSIDETIFWNIPAELKAILTEGTTKLLAGNRVEVELKGLQDKEYNNITISYWTEFFAANPKKVTGYSVYIGGSINTDKKTKQKYSYNVQGEEKEVSVYTEPYDATDKRYTIDIVNKDLAVYNEQTKKVKFLKPGTTTLKIKSKSDETVITTVILEIKAAPYSVVYRTHVQEEGWQEWKQNGEMSGTEGKSYRLEGIEITANGTNFSGGIEYSTHVQNLGWQEFKKNGAMAGTSGKSLRLEGIKIRLTGDAAKKYDIYYRVHAQEFGWLGWAKNGEEAGTSGYSYRLEGIQIKLVEKGGTAPGNTANAFRKAPPSVIYTTQVQDVGWQKEVKDGGVAGTVGKGLRLEGIRISLKNTIGGGIQYKTHIQDLGWEKEYKSNGATSGTEGKSLRLEAIKMMLTGEMAKKYDIYYRVHAQEFGWMGWAKNGEEAGTAGYGYRLEGIQIKLVEKGGKAPGDTAGAYKCK